MEKSILRNKDPSPVHYPCSVRLVSCLTGGLGSLYSRISLRIKLPLHDCGTLTNSDGSFHPCKNMPLMAHRYRYLQVVGHAHSALVIKAEDTFNCDQLVAIKVLHVNYTDLGHQEADCLRRLNASDPLQYAPVLRLYSTFMLQGHYCMVSELLDSKPLLHYFKNIQSHEERLCAVRKVTVRLLGAVGFTHQQNVIHADLKPENILLKNAGKLDSVKVIDFGNAFHTCHSEISLYYDDFELQTLLYRAPEVIFGSMFGMKVDMWSVGCILAELFLGKQPLFTGENKRAVVAQMVELLGPLPQQVYQCGKYFSELSTFTANCIQSSSTLSLMKRLGCQDYTFADFLSKLLRYDPGDRMSVEEAADHEFLAPELSTKFFKPLSQLNSGYKSVMLSAQSYTHQPSCSDTCRKAHRCRHPVLNTATSSTNNASFLNRRVVVIPQAFHSMNTFGCNSTSSGDVRTRTDSDDVNVQRRRRPVKEDSAVVSDKSGLSRVSECRSWSSVDSVPVSPSPRGSFSQSPSEPESNTTYVVDTVIVTSHDFNTKSSGVSLATKHKMSNASIKRTIDSLKRKHLLKARTSLPPSVATGHRAPPSVATGHRAPPSVATGHRAPPSVATGHRAPPSVATGHRAPPSVDTGHRAPPSVDTGHRAPPSVATGHRAPPSVATGHRAPPSVATGHRAPPSVATGHRAPPSVATGHRAPPSVATGHRAPPSVDTGHRAPPSVDTGHRAPPSVATGHRAPPSVATGHRAPPSVATGHRAPPSVATGHRAPPSVATGHRASPLSSYCKQLPPSPPRTMSFSENVAVKNLSHLDRRQNYKDARDVPSCSGDIRRSVKPLRDNFEQRSSTLNETLPAKRFRQTTCHLNRTFVLEGENQVSKSSDEDDSDASITSGPSVRDAQVTSLTVFGEKCDATRSIPDFFVE